MDNKCMKMCSKSLVIREIKIKITRHHFTSPRMVIIKKVRSVGDDVETLEL